MRGIYWWTLKWESSIPVGVFNIFLTLQFLGLFLGEVRVIGYLALFWWFSRKTDLSNQLLEITVVCRKILLTLYFKCFVICKWLYCLLFCIVLFRVMELLGFFKVYIYLGTHFIVSGLLANLIDILMIRPKSAMYFRISQVITARNRTDDRMDWLSYTLKENFWLSYLNLLIPLPTGLYIQRFYILINPSLTLDFQSLTIDFFNCFYFLLFLF